MSEIEIEYLNCYSEARTRVRLVSMHQRFGYSKFCEEYDLIKAKKSKQPSAIRARIVAEYERTHDQGDRLI